MFRNIKTNDNARQVVAFCPLEYINPVNPSPVFQNVDNLRIRQNYGPINSLHFPERIYHNQDSKIRVFPTHKQLRTQKDQTTDYDERAAVGFEMTEYLWKTKKSGFHSGWNGYESVPEREILSYDKAVKSLNNVRFSFDPEISIYQDIKLFFTRVDKDGVTVDNVSLKEFDDLKGVFVDKELNRQKIIDSPAQFLSELRYNISHGYDATNANASRTSLPLSIEIQSSEAESDEEPAYNESEALRLSNEVNDKLFSRVVNLENQISELKESLFIQDSKIYEMTGVLSAVLEVNEASLKKNNLVQSKIVVHDRIFNFDSGFRAQIYKFRNKNKSEKAACECYQCELQQTCTRTQKIIEIGLENCCIKPKLFVFGKNVDGHVCEVSDPDPNNIELTEITCRNMLGSKNKEAEESLSISVNIDSHDSREHSCRAVVADNKQSTPIKLNNPVPRVLVPADIDDTAEISRPSFPDSDCSSQMQWTEVLSTHEDFMSETE